MFWQLTKWFTNLSKHNGLRVAKMYLEKKKKKKEEQDRKICSNRYQGFLFVCLFVLIAGNKIMTDCSGIEKKQSKQ